MVNSGSMDTCAVHSIIGTLMTFVQMLHGAATASSLHPYGRSSVKNTRTVKT